MATLRLKSIKNIEKITKSMKMIASTQLAKAQRAMAAGKQYGIANSGPWRLFIVISSDKGLCGGIHSSVTKATRHAFAGSAESPLLDAERRPVEVDAATPIMIVGDKAKDVPTFANAAGVADLVVKSGVPYDSVVIIYNKFVSAISYEPTAVEVRGEARLKESEGFKAYEMEDDFTKDLAEFSLASAIFTALTEAHAYAKHFYYRRNAMDNASKNATDMITSLQMQYNCGRQAAITDELVDIITGSLSCMHF
ncbi:ATP synthase F1 gamma [Mycena albidolilacea]|uniref:ATP synthase subunit gamma, mitochondrial n=1 Tax=Mycena albidolilacea TaxID=1033008 RepID=A0AAD7EHU7_9AGAR|nr:ATP synthase F1 gamma [Mycena albidolilacea]